MPLFVIRDDNKLAGTLTDGDIRRALVNGASLETKIDDVMHRNYRYIQGDDIDVEEIRKFRRQGITLIPWLDVNGKIRQIVDLSDNHTILPLSAILMAGGKGERLRPLTLDTPKPLLKIGEKAIIDYNIEALARCGITNITVTTRYLAEKIHDHFRNPVAGVKVKCVKEEDASGTIGSASLVDLPVEGYTIVMNSDLLTTISFEDMYLHHLSNKADITIAAIPYQVSVPFAILSTDKERADKVIGLEEKPSYSYFANAGIYIFPNSVLR
ncbi:MAG: NTP transferase domain-containing protein, partial [Muribaculaceae bacterium]|nr:NTP transferase domain-containing protein [Muribaculaceae bacterium]